MLFEILFGIVTSLVSYYVIRIFFEEYDQSNFYLYYAYGALLLLLSLLILIGRILFSREMFASPFWNTFMVSNLVIVAGIGIHIYLKIFRSSKK
ncbi:MAG: hypothetical protein ONB31_09035 [candidate division KSB1 bacterium]|nr:hypothetical protein [candidate division KSB1 bacterium]MDZ7333684.1 hypothetical protein [candidate division KSB1 bacterium]MDZ7356132.1 hypothetical protein [candidate division KSB1 bacterium]MDZ7398890.1 hypothetical protein [candidate division KSB1 bacterium]